MKSFLIGSLTGAIAAAAIMTVGDNSQEHYERLNRIQSMAVDAQQLAIRETNKVMKLGKTLDKAVVALKDQMSVVKSELADLQSNQSALRIEREKMEAALITKIDTLYRTVESTPNNSTSSKPTRTDEAESADAQSDSVDDAIAKTDRLAIMDDALDAQIPDPTWDNGAAGELSDRFHSEDFAGSQLESVTCRGSMCRLEIYHEDDSASGAWFEAEHQLVPWSHKGRIETLEDASGKLITVMYITRDGFDFPSES